MYKMNINIHIYTVYHPFLLASCLGAAGAFQDEASVVVVPSPSCIVWQDLAGRNQMQITKYQRNLVVLDSLVVVVVGVWIYLMNSLPANMLTQLSCLLWQLTRYERQLGGTATIMQCNKTTMNKSQWFILGQQ